MAGDLKTKTDADRPGCLSKLSVGFGDSSPEIRKLFASAESFGITDREFSWERKLTGVLGKLLGD